MNFRNESAGIPRYAIGVQWATLAHTRIVSGTRELPYTGSKSGRSDHRKLDWHPNLAQLGKAAGTLAPVLVLGAAPSAAWACGHRSRSTSRRKPPAWPRFSSVSRAIFRTITRC